MIKGIGVDIVNTKRLFEKRERFAEFVLTSNEYKQYKSLEEGRKLNYLAGRFASKEAFVKALGGTIKDYEILNDENGKPISKSGLVTISHDGDYAVAFVVVEE